MDQELKRLRALEVLVVSLAAELSPKTVFMPEDGREVPYEAQRVLQEWGRFQAVVQKHSTGRAKLMSGVSIGALGAFIGGVAVALIEPYLRH